MYPRLDQAASEQAGESLELVTRIRANQPFVPAGPRVSLTAVELLGTATLSGRWPRRNLKHDSAGELITAGLLGEDGRVTPAGNALGEVWRSPRAMVSVIATHETRTTQLRSWISESAAVIEAGIPLAALADASAHDDDLRSLQMVGIGQAMDVVARWIGIAPAWTFEIEPEELSIDVFEARLRDPHTPAPQNANGFLQRLWSEPWTSWKIFFGMDDDTSGLGMVTVGTLGFLNYAPRTDEGVVSLRPVPPAQLYRELYTRFGDALSTGPARHR